MVIIKAAIMFQNGEIIEGHDYGHISTLAHKLSFTGEKIYGFVTNTGAFLLPNEAAVVALATKQITEQVDALTPEILWPNVGTDS